MLNVHFFLAFLQRRQHSNDKQIKFSSTVALVEEQTADIEKQKADKTIATSNLVDNGRTFDINVRHKTTDRFEVNQKSLNRAVTQYPILRDLRTEVLIRQKPVTRNVKEERQVGSAQPDQNVLPPVAVNSVGETSSQTARTKADSTSNFVNRNTVFEPKLSIAPKLPVSGIFDTFLGQKIQSLSHLKNQNNANNNIVKFDKSTSKETGENLLPESQHSEPLDFKLLAGLKESHHIAKRSVLDELDGKRRVTEQRLAKELPKPTPTKMKHTSPLEPITAKPTGTLTEELPKPTTAAKNKVTKIKNISPPHRTTAKPSGTKSVKQNQVRTTHVKILNVNHAVRTKDAVEEILATKAIDDQGLEVEEVEDREADKCPGGSKCYKPAPAYHGSDAYWAAASLLTVLVLLTFGVLYTGLLKRRNTFDRFQASPEHTSNGDVEMDNMSAINIQSK